METNEKILDLQQIWESLTLPKDYHIEKRLSSNLKIFFVIKGSVTVIINRSETHSIFSHEMFMVQTDNSYEIDMLEPTHLIICHDLEAWYVKQKWIEGLIPDDEDISEVIFKLPIKKVILRFLSLVDFYLKDGIYSFQFFELKRRELVFLLFYYYQKNELAQFLKYILSRDIQFKKFVMNNYLRAGNVQELAKLANYSASGFIKKFQKCFHISPYRWMQQQKAKQIFIDIHQGCKSLQEISNEYKFSSYQHFSGFCKAQLGATPTAILGRNRKNNE